MYNWNVEQNTAKQCYKQRSYGTQLNMVIIVVILVFWPPGSKIHLIQYTIIWHDNPWHKIMVTIHVRQSMSIEEYWTLIAVRSTQNEVSVRRQGGHPWPRRRLSQWQSPGETVMTNLSMQRHPPWWSYTRKLNTSRPRQNDRHFPDDVFKYISLNGSIWISPKI